MIHLLRKHLSTSTAVLTMRRDAHYETRDVRYATHDLMRYGPPVNLAPLLSFAVDTAESRSHLNGVRKGTNLVRERPFCERS